MNVAGHPAAATMPIDSDDNAANVAGLAEYQAKENCTVCSGMIRDLNSFPTWLDKNKDNSET